MVDVTTALPSNGGESLIGRTRGALRSVRSALGGSGEYLQGLGNRIGSALSSSLEENELTTTSFSSPSSPPTPPQTIKPEEQLGIRRKLRLPRYKRTLFFIITRFIITISASDLRTKQSDKECDAETSDFEYYSNR